MKFIRLRLKKWWWVPLVAAFALIVWWEEERCQAQAYQCRANYAAQAQSQRISSGIISVDRNASEDQAIAAACEPNGYFCRLFGAANLPTMLLVFIGIGGIWAALKTLDAIERELVLNQRPRISVSKFYFTEMRGTGGVYNIATGIQNGSFCNGQFYIRNVGGSEAHIEEIHCEVWAVEDQGRLPMKCPYEGKDGREGQWRLLPGQSMTWLFGRTTPLVVRNALARATGNAPLYVLGWISYKDDLGIYRSMGFCRSYDGSTDRFVPVNNPDYEYAD